MNNAIISVNECDAAAAAEYRNSIIVVVAADSIGGVHVGVTGARLHRSNSVVRSRGVSSHLLSANGMYHTVVPPFRPSPSSLFCAYYRNSRLAI